MILGFLSNLWSRFWPDLWTSHAKHTLPAIGMSGLGLWATSWTHSILGGFATIAFACVVSCFASMSGEWMKGRMRNAGLTKERDIALAQCQLAVQQLNETRAKIAANEAKANRTERRKDQ